MHMFPTYDPSVKCNLVVGPQVGPAVSCLPSFLEYVYFENSRVSSDIFNPSILVACLLTVAIYWMEFAEAGKILANYVQ